MSAPTVTTLSAGKHFVAKAREQHAAHMISPGWALLGHDITGHDFEVLVYGIDHGLIDRKQITWKTLGMRSSLRRVLMTSGAEAAWEPDPLPAHVKAARCPIWCDGCDDYFDHNWSRYNDHHERTHTQRRWSWSDAADDERRIDIEVTALEFAEDGERGTTVSKKDPILYVSRDVDGVTVPLTRELARALSDALADLLEDWPQD